MNRIRHNFASWSFFIISILLFISCKTKDKTNEKYSFILPSYMPSPPKEPSHNPTTKEGVILGKMLFFDTKLSKNNTISCATCHNPKLYFTDNLDRSNLGATGKKLNRNTPTLINVAYAENGLFLDGGIKNLESLPAAPLNHPDEMAMDLKKLPFLLQKDRKYPALFKNAFGNDTITNALIFRALAQYQRTIISPSHPNSEFHFMTQWDSVQQNKTTFSKSEVKGQKLFEIHCNSCHTAPLFSDYKFHFFHLDSTTRKETNSIKHSIDKNELGRQRITQNPNDYLKFKTPTLRHISKTFPYLHDGSIDNLNYFLEGNNLSNEEKRSLLEFLDCL
ncbi:cytochrome-c peroxidase [Bernardetia sp. ABR2-2B]|uniref:cytochrome-c peroxidase n=1 Tax=Bernardetia sp. ABR2-2B TaxID=3127472 RepID=UPI0030CEDC3B